MTFHRGQGLNNSITDAADLLQHLRSMKDRTSAELRVAVLRYEKDLVPRGHTAVLASNENTNAVHDWATMMQFPLFSGGLAREGDKIEVDERKRILEEQNGLGGAGFAVLTNTEVKVGEEVALEENAMGLSVRP
jgi:hypothetical protein